MNTVEEKIVERAARKLRVDHLIMQRGKFNLFPPHAVQEFIELSFETHVEHR